MHWVYRTAQEEEEEKIGLTIASFESSSGFFNLIWRSLDWCWGEKEEREGGEGNVGIRKGC